MRLCCVAVACALWAFPVRADDVYERAAVENIRRAGMPFEVLSAAEGKRRWPQMNWDGISWAILETEAGHLFARRACQAADYGSDELRA